jgi:hypothetical protein
MQRSSGQRSRKVARPIFVGLLVWETRVSPKRRLGLGFYWLLLTRQGNAPGIGRTLRIVP